MITGKNVRRAAALCVIAALLSGGGALADAVSVTAERLNVRTEASADSKAVTVVRRGETLRYVCEAGEWIEVVANGKTGYVMKQYVSVDPEQIAADVAASLTMWSAPQTGRATARVNLRALPMTDSDALKVIGKNESVTLTGACGDWYYAEFGGKTGYVMRDYVLTGGELPAEAIQPTASAELTAYADSAPATAAARVNVRASASTDSKVVKVLAKGAPLSVTGEMGGWYRVYASGATGYIMKQFVTLTTAAPAATPEPASALDGDYAQAVAATINTRVNMRAAASTDAAIVKVLARGAAVSLTGESGAWYKVTAADRTGYVYKQYVTIAAAQQPEIAATPEPAPTSPPDVETAYAAAVSADATARVNMRAAASVSSAIVKVIGLNERVSVVGEKGGWYKVSYEGRTGYVMKDFLTLSSEVQNASFESWTGVAVVEVNMRKAPEGDVMYVLRAGTEMSVTGQNGSWYLINYRGSVGYVASSYVVEKSAYATPAPDPTPAPAATGAVSAGSTAYVSGAAVNVRSGPGTTYGVLKTVRIGDELTVYEQSGGWYRVSVGGVNGYISAKFVSAAKPEATATVAPGEVTVGRVVSSDWWTGTIATVFKRGTTGTVTDVDTGLSFQIKRTGGVNHLDAQPLTADDTEIMYRIYGYKWQWTRRAIWVTYNGVTYAASMNGMPHGESDSMPDNDFDGCFCIHFTNSRTHAGNRLDAAHQAAVQKALKAGNQ